ncbi:toll/interleukin-1 receptor domain-containing protein [Actinosynnema sp. NPDC050801]|uniref:toll/interleukin-1 receptor domain-containing protein n=1 Tax=unclassified Actinosynnema TaxID=2637065 RepID=UPI00340BDFF7
MHHLAGARASTKDGTLPIVLLSLVLMQAAWATYSGVTEFEVDIDHGRSSPWDLVMGVVSAGEVVGVLLVFARRNAGFAVAVSAEVLRFVIAVFTKASVDGYILTFTIVSPFVLLYVYSRLDDVPDEADADGTPPDGDVDRPTGRKDRAGSPQVFLSYSRRQFYFAESLMLRLDGNAIPVWFDTHRIQAGADWKESIDGGLAACTSLVLVASRDALKSKNVDYEWRTALKDGKQVYVVLFEAVALPPELSREAVAIIDLRSRFEAKVETLVELLTQPRRHRDRAPKGNPLRLPSRLPPSVFLTTTALGLIFAASLFFDVLNARVLLAITEPHARNLPEDVDPSFTTHLLGFTFHGLSSKVYAFLGITVMTLLLTALSAFLLVAVLYRRRFVLALLPLALLGSAWLYVNTSFIEHSTSHVIVSVTGGLMSTPANLHSSAWRDLDDMLLGQYVDYGSSYAFTYGSSFLSTGDASPYLTATSAQWRWPTLLLLGLAVVAFWKSRRSASLYRWLATGVAPERLRLQHNEPPGAHRGDHHVLPARLPSRTASERPPGWRLLHHPADGHIAAEIEAALADRGHADGESPERRVVPIVLLTNRTRLDWLEELERENPDLVYVVCTSVRQVETLALLGRHQWFDYRERSHDKLALLARSLRQGSSTSADYSFPALPERLTRTVVPGPVRYKSHAMRLCATWLAAVALFGEGRVYSSFVHDEGSGRLIPWVTGLMFWICLPCCLYLFWLAVELTSARTTYRRFRTRLNIVMVTLLITQLQFLLSFDDQFGTVLLGALVNVFLAMAWLTPDAGHVRRWLPAVQSPVVGTLAVPLRHQFGYSSTIYLGLFVFCYLSAAMFFADAA